MSNIFIGLDLVKIQKYKLCSVVLLLCVELRAGGCARDTEDGAAVPDGGKQSAARPGWGDGRAVPK